MVIPCIRVFLLFNLFCTLIFAQEKRAETWPLMTIRVLIAVGKNYDFTRLYFSIIVVASLHNILRSSTSFRT